MGVIRRLLATGCVIFLLGSGGTAAFVLTYAPPALPDNAAAVVVLSAGTTANGRMTPETAARARSGVTLWQELASDGEAPLLVMSGGRGGGDPRAKAAMMADAARDAGVPPARLRAEGGSHSTLQNALFTRDILGPIAEDRLILVSSAYHLPRAWASFRWAGMDGLTLYAADGPNPRLPTVPILLEGVKWPVNILRAAGYSAADALGVPEAGLTPLLH
ncbi:YdcF family protein [Tranquillimonas rosea]|uniref:YdcF family protein n=1 Tax=Tranquillimonas rosea TaxID=641238 RepID=UPI003BAC6C16